MNLAVLSRVAEKLTSRVSVGKRRLSYPVVVVLVAIVYLVVGKSGLQFAVVHENVTLVWGAAAVALVALLKGGLRLWPAITLGAFLVNFGTGLSLPVVLVIAFGNTLGCVVGAYLLLYVVRMHLSFDRIADVFLFVACGVIVSTFISAAIGSLALVLGQGLPIAGVPHVWLEWWMGDAIGVLILVPFILLWWNNFHLHKSYWKWIEFVGLTIAVCLAGYIIFARDISEATDYPLAYLIIPFIIWVALRFSMKATVIICLLISFVGTNSIAQQLSILTDAQLHRDLIYLWSFIAVTTICALSLSAIIADRRRFERELLRERDYITQVMNAMAHGVAVTDMDGRFEYLNPAYAQMLGSSQEALIGKIPNEVLPPSERAIVSNTSIRLTSDFRTAYETRFHRQDGTSLDVLVHGSLRRDQVDVTGIITAVTDLTEQKKTEAALRHSEARLRSIINNLPFDLWVHDAQGRCILQTPESIKLWGDVQGKTVAEVNVSSEIIQSWQAMNARVARGETLRGDVTYPIDNHQRHFYNITSPVRDEKGASLGILGINIDITERVLAQAALQQSEETSNAFLEQLKALQDITIELAQTESFDSFCLKAIELGRSRLKFDRMGLWLIDEDDPDFTVGSFGTAEDGTIRDERNVRAPTAIILPQLTNVIQIHDKKFYYNPDSPHLNDHSESVGHGWSAIGYLSDGKQIIGGLSTDNYFSHEPPRPYQLELLTLYSNALGHLCVLKRAEASLQVSEERFRSVFSSAKVGIALANTKGYIISANPAIQELLGYTELEYSRMTFAQLTHPDDRDSNNDLFKQLLQGEITFFQLEKRYIRKNGESVWVRLNVSPFPGRYETHVIAIVENIDARKQAEAEIQMLNANLEQRVTDRTIELQVANERLTELDRLKSKFIADVTHELRTPLTVLSTRVYLLHHSPPEKHAGHLIALKEQLERLTNFVNATLDLSRLELLDEKVAFGSIDLNDVVQQVISALHLRAEVAGLQMTFQPQTIPPVRGEFNQLAQVVTNLVANAVNYTPNGSITVTTLFDESHSEVCLKIADTGMGISEGDIPHLFTRFYRGERAGQSNIPGTGLGLSIVKEIVDLHKGRIKIESQVGKGTVFTIALPIYQPS